MSQNISPVFSYPVNIFCKNTGIRPFVKKNTNQNTSVKILVFGHLSYYELHVLHNFRHHPSRISCRQKLRQCLQRCVDRFSLTFWSLLKPEIVLNTYCYILLNDLIYKNVEAIFVTQLPNRFYFFSNSVISS